MGLRRLDLDDWLEVDDHQQAQLAEKARLLSVARNEVLVHLPVGLEPSAELLELVVEHVGKQPDPRALVEHEAWARGTAAASSAPHPIEAAARLTQEDLCVLQQLDGEWRLVAACVCFPSRWSLTEKLGASLTAIHDPVPGFDRELARPATTFFDRLAVQRPVWRLNWTLLDTEELHLPSPVARRSSGVELTELGHAVWFRVERQTLRRLARTRAIAFTIRTYVTALGELVERYPDVRHSLRATLQTVPDDVAAYKGWTELLAPLDAWLAEREGLASP